MPKAISPILIFLSLFTIWIQQLSAQEVLAISHEHSNWTAGISFKAYPAGIIFGGRIDKRIGSKNNISFMVGYNLARHQDFGVHEDERGGGPGISFGYRRYLLRENRVGLYLGANQDFWMNTLDWKDRIGTPNEMSGTTSILVVQPTAEAGWTILLGNKLELTPNVAFGIEINTMQDGADVGQGAILLGGIHAGYRF